MKQSFVFLLILGTALFSAPPSQEINVTELTKEYELKEKPGVKIGPGFFLSTKDYDKLLLSAIRDKKKIKLQENEIDYLKERNELYRERDKLLKEIKEEREKIKKEREENFKLYKDIVKENKALYEDNERMMEKQVAYQRRKARFYRRILFTGAIMAVGQNLKLDVFKINF